MWSEGGPVMHGIQDASAEILKNADIALNSRNLNQASQLLSAIEKSKPWEGSIWRGISVSEADAKALQAQMGKEFMLPISSFSGGKGVAEEFAGYGMGDVKVIIDARNIRGLAIDDWVLEEYQDQAEILVAGTFRVGPVFRNGNDMVMVLEEI